MTGSRNYTILAYKNLKRRPIRTVLTGLAIAMSVAVMVTILGLGIGYRKALIAEIERSGYQVLVTAKGCPYEAATIMLKGGGGLRYITEKIYDKIATNPHVSKITPQLIEVVHDSDDDKFIFLLGVQIETFLELRPWLKFKSGKGFSGEDVDEVIMGYEAAELEQREAGDKFYIDGVDKIFTVAGILERVGSQEDGTIFMPLKTLQKVFKRQNQLTGMGLMLKDFNRFEEFAEELFRVPEIQVVSMGDVKEKFLSLFGKLNVLLIMVGVVALLISIVSLMNTILISVFERTPEIGVLKAIGAGQWDILKLIWTESVLISILGWLIGITLTIVGTGMVTYIITRILPYVPEGTLILLPIRLI
ncbi:MAG: ABC transporter permease [Thermodesulfobacteriota bacterium]|nr:ABC transporter permease [Thermodesulfobacteriota bacterium]